MKVACAFRRLNDYFEKVSTLLNSGIDSIESRPDHIELTFCQYVDVDFAKAIIDSALHSHTKYSYDNIDADSNVSTFNLTIDDSIIYVRIMHCRLGTEKDYAVLSFDTAIRLEELEQYYDSYYQ